MTLAATLVLLLIAALAFGYHTGRDRARDDAAFRRARRGWARRRALEPKPKP